MVCALSCGSPTFESKYFFHENLRVCCLPLEIHRNWQSDSGASGLSKLCIDWNNFLVLVELLFISSATIVVQAKLELSCGVFFPVYSEVMLLGCPWVLGEQHSVQGVKGTLCCFLVSHKQCGYICNIKSSFFSEDKILTLQCKNAYTCCCPNSYEGKCINLYWKLCHNILNILKSPPDVRGRTGRVVSLIFMRIRNF